MATMAIISQDEVAKLVPRVVAQAQSITIMNSEDHEIACAFLTFVATGKKQVEEVFDPIVKKAHETHKEAVAQKKKFLDPLLMAEMNVKGKIVTYDTEMQRLRREKEIADAKILQQQQQEAAIAEAQQLEASGDKELADLVLETAATAPAPVVILPPAVEKQEGVSMRQTWKFRITDERLIPREYLMVNESAIGAVVRAQKGMTRIPGIQVYPESGVSVRTK
jgi:regulator of protease activity HflC (stomatin/prohibitin superfamily)